MTSFASPLWRGFQAYQIYGANTNVGKTVVSTLLCKASKSPASARGGVGFLKPVSTGPLDEADDRHIKAFATGTATRCLYQFKQPVSPHLAASDDGLAPEDEEVVVSIHRQLSCWAKDGLSHAFVETAGGVHSPGPSGTSQADLYRPLRLPVILVADSRLGGISSTVSAYESLHVRGYDVESVLMFKEGYYKNDEYLLDYFGTREVPLLAFQTPPIRPDGHTEEHAKLDRQRMTEYYKQVSESDPRIGNLLSNLSKRHEERVNKLRSMASRAHKTIWYPFTQHKGLKPETLTVIDSASGDHFQVYRSESGGHEEGSQPIIGPVFDGSASWWTQGLGHGNPQLALGAAYAAGRYGHVMFAMGAHEPAIKLAELVLSRTGNERLTRVFYSDNGSTGMEVALKMALRASCHRYGWNASDEEVGILGLKGSYHGDTIGAMDCSEPSTFNKQVEWYRGRGHWFDFPQIKMVDGVWTVQQPKDMHLVQDQEQAFSSLDEIFDLEKRQNSELACSYRTFVRETLQDLCETQGRKFGALILEPIVLGAGGMLLADPLFQQILVDTVRSEPQIIGTPQAAVESSSISWSGLPVIFDEVFTGMYRLFHFTPSNFFPPRSRPDIAVNAKLLTGGLLPLSITLASEAIFKIFNSSPHKEQALLHGHSYTAHPVGCHVACLSVEKMTKMETEGDWDEFKRDWSLKRSSGSQASTTEPLSRPEIWSVWPHSLLEDLSRAETVESVWSLGTILAIVLRDPNGGGYSSSVAQSLQRKLREGSRPSGNILPPNGAADKSTSIPFDVQSRVLGNVFYLMTSLTSRKEEIERICGMLRASLL